MSVQSAFRSLVPNFYSSVLTLQVDRFVMPTFGDEGWNPAWRTERGEYSATPNDQNIPTKMRIISTYALKMGVSLGLGWCVLVKRPTNAWQTVHAMGQVIVPLVASAAAYPVANGMLANINDKNHKVNSMFAGISSGIVMGYLAKSRALGAVTTIFFPIGALVYETCLEYDIPILRPPKLAASFHELPYVKPYVFPFGKDLFYRDPQKVELWANEEK